MHIIIMIISFFFWLYIQAEISRSGYPRLSRSQMRYIKKKSRATNTDIDYVPYNPRNINQPKEFEVTERGRKIVSYIKIFSIVSWSGIIIYYIHLFYR